MRGSNIAGKKLATRIISEGILGSMSNISVAYIFGNLICVLLEERHSGHGASN